MTFSIDPESGLKEYRSDKGSLLSTQSATSDEILLWERLNSIQEIKSIEWRNLGR